jgi:hypothetical protein
MAQQELREEIQEVWALFRDTDRRMRETDEWIKETGRIVKETSEQVKETSRKVGQLNETVSALTGKWGKFVEGLVAPGAVRMFKERGIEVERTSTRNKIQKNGTEIEIDILLENDEYVVAIEVKSTLTVEDVNEHLEKLSRFREFFPHRHQVKSFFLVPLP